MAISEYFAGSQALDNATEWSLSTDTSFTPDAQTDDGVYQLYVDLNDMVNTDIVRFRMYEKVGSGSTQRVAWECVLRDAQTELILVSPSFLLMHGWDFTAIMLSATNYTCDWSIRRVV
jgi:hypothetical protein